MQDTPPQCGGYPAAQRLQHAHRHTNASALRTSRMAKPVSPTALGRNRRLFKQTQHYQ